MAPEEIEGRLLAQRRMLQLIAAALAGTPAGERIRELLAERATLAGRAGGSGGGGDGRHGG